VIVGRASATAQHPPSRGGESEESHEMPSAPQGRRIGLPYKVIRELGHGGMRTVYLWSAYGTGFCERQRQVPAVRREASRVAAFSLGSDQDMIDAWL
jgi:hypothetical protein